jgi:hypothetical protein
VTTKRTWAAGAALFSGRRDPVWTVRSAAAVKLVRIWDRLQPFGGRRPAPPALGYRGCFLESPEGDRWEAFGGVVRSEAESRADPEGAFEIALVKTAPDPVKKDVMKEIQK